jgi:hypothetical protein
MMEAATPMYPRKGAIFGHESNSILIKSHKVYVSVVKQEKNMEYELRAF